MQIQKECEMIMPVIAPAASPVNSDEYALLLDTDACLAGLRLAYANVSTATQTTDQRAGRDAVMFLERFGVPQRMQLAIRVIVAAHAEIANGVDFAVYLIALSLCSDLGADVPPTASDQEVRAFWREVSGIAEPSELYLRRFGGVLLHYGIEQLRRLATGAEEYDRRINAMLWPHREED